MKIIFFNQKELEMKIFFQDSLNLEMKMKIENQISFFLSPFDIFIISFIFIFVNNFLFSRSFFENEKEIK